jgi:hypothetical protein
LSSPFTPRVPETVKMPSTTLRREKNEGMETLKTEARRERRRTTYWLIVERGPDRPVALTVGAFSDEEALAVFSFEEEALLFLSVQGLAETWAVTEVVADELASVLSGSYPGWVTLDPLPGPLGGKMAGLLSVERKRFLAGLERRATGDPLRPFVRPQSRPRKRDTFPTVRPSY